MLGFQLWVDAMLEDPVHVHPTLQSTWHETVIFLSRIAKPRQTLNVSKAESLYPSDTL